MKRIRMIILERPSTASDNLPESIANCEINLGVFDSSHTLISLARLMLKYILKGHHDL
jgi:hypothetical protein